LLLSRIPIDSSEKPKVHKQTDMKSYNLNRYIGQIFFYSSCGMVVPSNYFEYYVIICTFTFNWFVFLLLLFICSKESVSFRRTIPIVRYCVTGLFLEPAESSSHGHTLFSCIWFYVFTVVIMNVAIFWDIVSFSPYMNGRFEGTYYLHPQCRKPAEQETAVLIFYPEDGDVTFLWHVHSHTDYTALYPRRLQH
jgi:hypothetical protein